MVFFLGATFFLVAAFFFTAFFFGAAFFLTATFFFVAAFFRFDFGKGAFSISSRQVSNVSVSGSSISLGMRAFLMPSVI